MNLSINRTISLKMNNQSQFSHSQNDIFTYLCLTVALKALGTQRNVFLMNQKMQLKCISLIRNTCCQKYTQKDSLQSEAVCFLFCLFYYNREKLKTICLTLGKGLNKLQYIHTIKHYVIVKNHVFSNNKFRKVTILS